jgi:hypothetical protein
MTKKEFLESVSNENIILVFDKAIFRGVGYEK